MGFRFRRIGECNGALFWTGTDGLPGDDKVNGDAGLRIEESAITAGNGDASNAH